MCKEFIKQDEIFKNIIKEIDDYLLIFRDFFFKVIFENEEDFIDLLKNYFVIFVC